MKPQSIKILSQVISQRILYSVGVSCLDFYVVLSEFMMEAILPVILLSVMNVVFCSTSQLSLQKGSHQMTHVPQ